MRSTPFLDPALSVASYYSDKERRASPRYRWNNWERGDQPFVILQWTLSGEGRFESARGVQPVPEEFAFVALVPGRSTYFYPPEGREPWVFSWLNFYGDLAYELFRAFETKFGPVIPLPRRSAAASALRRLFSLIAKSKGTSRWQVSLQAYTFILEWWRELMQPQGRSEDGLELAIRFCRERFREPLAVKEIAHEAGMSREHFSRIFVQRLGKTPAAFLRRLRLNEAATLLRDTRLPLGEIAMRSGFYSARHLMLTFRRERGVNPSLYRKRK
jgi:AraC-like DNA-binding protein